MAGARSRGQPSSATPASRRSRAATCGSPRAAGRAPRRSCGSTSWSSGSRPTIRDADEDLLNRAYVFAMKAHGSQLRASRRPLLPPSGRGRRHPDRLQARQRLDRHRPAARHGRGHRRHARGDRAAVRQAIARLVDGVTKLNRLELQSAQTAQAENFRKLLLAMSDDIRVLLVKLADRLHNMRTLHFIGDPDKRRRIAAETMEIYAPLAERIGMAAMKAELEDLAFAELSPDARDSILHRLRQLRRDDEGAGRADRRGAARRRSARAGIDAEITGREKSALLDLAQDAAQERQLRAALRHHGVPRRSSTTSPTATRRSASSTAPMRCCPDASRTSSARPSPTATARCTPPSSAPSGARSRCRSGPRRCTRSPSSASPRTGPTSRSTQITEGRQYRWIRELLDILEHATGPEEFLENTKLEMYQDQVFCFTPKGDLIALPRGATPVDFAYAVHSEVGDHCVGAKVDGRMVQLRYQLQNGDQVEIITSKNGAPSPAWERFVVTGKARARIRRYLRARAARRVHPAGARAAAAGRQDRRHPAHRQAARAGASPPFTHKSRRRSAGGGRRGQHRRRDW